MKKMNKSWLACALMLISLLGGAQAADVTSGTGSTGGSCSPATGGDPAKTCSGASNPINVTTGNKYQREVDMAPLPGVLGLELIRHYNSAYSTTSNVNGIVGRGWKLSYETELEAIGNSVQIIQADGERIIFARSPLDRNLCSTLDPAQGSITVARTDRGDEYLWRLPSGRQLSFNAQGKLVQIRVPSGEFVSLQHDRRGHLVKVTDPQGRTLQLTYLDPKARVSNSAQPRFSGVQHIDTPVGRYSYQYGSPLPKGTKASALEVSANLVQVSLPAGKGLPVPSRQYLYEDARWPTLLTGIAVGSQRVATYAYNERGWAVRSENGQAVDLLELERASLNERGQPGRVVLVHSKDAQHPQGQALEVLSAQVAGQYRITETRGVACPITLNCPAGNVRYAYDEGGRTRQVTYFAPPAVTRTDKGWQVAPLSQALRADKYDYDGLGRTTRHIDVRYSRAPGQPMRTTAPTTERIVQEVHYDGPSDRIALVRQPSVVPGQWHEVRTSYNDVGQVTQVSQSGWRPALADAPAQPIERSTTYRYARINGRSVLAAADGPLPGPADTTGYDWDARADHLVRTRYPQGLRHSYQRDDAGRIAEETPPDGVSIAHTYLPTGQDTGWRRGPAQVTVSYDALLRPTRIDLPDGEVRRMAYEDRSGAVALASNTGQAQWITPPNMPGLPAVSNPAVQRLAPDLVPSTPPAPWTGQQVLVDDFGGLVALHTDTTGWETRRHDQAGRLIERRLADGTLWRWQRDALGRIVRHEVSRAGAQAETTTLTYQGVHLIGIDHPNERERHAYDALGRLASRTVQRASLGYTERFEYDEADRVVRQSLPEGGALSYTWGVGRQLRAIEHDDGRVSAVLGQGMSQWLGWGRHTLIEPLKAQATVVATAATPTATKVAASGPAIMQAALDKALQAEHGYRWGNGVELRWQLDQSGQLSSMRYQASAESSWQQALLAWLPSANAANATNATNAANASAVSGRPLLELAYAYDQQGRMSQRDEDGARTGYGYDASGRLLVAQGQADEVEYYAYEQGRMLGSEIQSQTTDWRQVHTERNASGMPQLIDRQGVIRRLSYSADNRLIEVKEGDKVLALYSHNTHGQRIGKTLGNGRATSYLWQGGQMVGETQPASHGALARRYVYAHGVPVAVIDYEHGARLQVEARPGEGGAWHQAVHWAQTAWQASTASAPKLTYLHTNEIGTPIAATNAQGKVIWRGSYSAYGLTKTKTTSRPGHVAQAGVQGIELNLRLPGQYFDAETGWYDNGLRTYDPLRGEYLEPDPLGPLPNIKAALVAWAQGRIAQPLTQPFAYANHNPLIYADPTGLILFAFDGTGNSDPAQSGSSLSNVQKLLQAYDQDQNGKAFYITGIGTTNKHMQFEGSEAAGTGFRERVDLGTEFLEDFIKSDTANNGKWLDVDVIGFSRGAAEARAWVSQIEKKLSESREFSTSNTGENKRCINFRFLGVWDTVPHAGADHGDEKNYDFSIPASVGLAAHAVAMNEHRGGIADFDLESIHANGSTANTGTRIERGFVGAHSDIGGGYAEGDLSDVALMWMIDQASSQGIAFDEEKIKSSGWNVVSNPVVHDSRVGKGFKEWLWSDGGDRELAYRDGSRVKQENAVMHDGVTTTDKARESINYFTKPCGADGTIVGLIDVKKYEAWLTGISVTFQPSPSVPEGCKLK